MVNTFGSVEQRACLHSALEAQKQSLITGKQMLSLCVNKTLLVTIGDGPRGAHGL